MSDRNDEPGVLDAMTLVRTLNEHRIMGFEEHPACLELRLSNGQTLTWWYGGMDESGDFKLSGESCRLTADEERLDQEWFILAQLDRTSWDIRQALMHLPMSGVGAFAAAMQKICIAQAEIHRLHREQFRKVVGK